MKTPEERFSDRVENYARHRPSYPAEAIDTLRHECGLRRGSVVADVGAGTGIFTALLLGAGWNVVAVEPNEAMRRAAEARFGGRRGFESRAGSAERTGLPEAAVDLVSAAQAFHWFRPAEARREFARILRPGGEVALIWNHRSTSTAFEQEYERLLMQWSREYARSDHRDPDERMIDFFDERELPMRRFAFATEQHFDLAGLKGRLESSSYAPTPGQSDYEPMMRELATAFAAHAVGGHVRLGYETRMYLGRVAGARAVDGSDFRGSI